MYLWLGVSPTPCICGLVYPRPHVSVAWRIPDSMYLWFGVSPTPCICDLVYLDPTHLWLGVFRPHASVVWCIPDPMYLWLGVSRPHVSVAWCIPNPHVSVAWCIPDPMHLLVDVSGPRVSQCASDPMYPLFKVFLAWYIHDLMCPPPRWPMDKSSASRAEDPGFDSRLWRGDFRGSIHTSDLKIGTPMATLPGAWRYRISAGTGWPGDSILWLGEV